MRRLVLILALAALSACVGGGGKVPAAPESPITGGAVSTTALAPPPGAAPVAAEPAAKPVAGAETAPAANPAAAPVPQGEVKIDIPPASPAERACRKDGGQWSKVGKGGQACLKATRDGGKACTRGTQCEGLCLARSGSCAPIAPMFGCNEILQDDGQRVTLCID